MSIKLSTVIKSIADNYNPGFPYWNPEKVRKGIIPIDPALAERLDYTSPDYLIQGLREEFPGKNLSPYIAEHKFCVWVDPNEPIQRPTSKYLVIAVLPDDPANLLGTTIPTIQAYASKCNADFVLLRGKTQGSPSNEKFRVKPFVELYDRTIVIEPDMLVKEECPNLFETVPEEDIGIYDESIELFSQTYDLEGIARQKTILMMSESFSRVPALSPDIITYIRGELELMPMVYDNGVVVCSKQHSNIWNPITFPFRQNDLVEQFWIELSIHRNGYQVYILPDSFNCQRWIKDFGDKLQTAYVIEHSDIPKYAWLDSIITPPVDIRRKEIIPPPPILQPKDDSIDQSLFKILCLGHCQEQFDTIEDRIYLEKVNLNDLPTALDNAWAEGRIYDIEFDSLFPADKKFVGLVTASWNQKYGVLHPIDKFHEWDGAKYLAFRNDKNIVLCANTKQSCEFSKGNSIIKQAMNSRRQDIKYLLNLVGLKEVCKVTAISNQIIAHRDVVKSLFDFYKDGDILSKIEFFLKKVKPIYVGKYDHIKLPGLLTEFITVFWFANQDFRLMPQELTLVTWYNESSRTLRKY